MKAQYLGCTEQAAQWAWQAAGSQNKNTSL